MAVIKNRFFRSIDMFNRTFFSWCVVVVALFFSVTSFAWAEGIKERMKQRLPQIVQIKKEGLIGENHKGYLEYVTEKRPHQEMVEAENSDRRKVYEMIAKNQGVSVEKVEVLRAAQIVEKAAKGEMLKRSDGSWYRK